jgi:ABC-type sugar transport system ATPase subunit
VRDRYLPLQVTGLCAGYRPGVPIVRDLCLRVEPGRVLALVGPSGAGKSTILRAIAGLLRPWKGDVTLGSRSVLGDRVQQRFIAMVFAQDALLRHRNVRGNLALALRARRSDHARLEDLARALDIERHLSRRPSQLSTGERQRVSIARALLSDPLVLLLDEPLAPLDPELRSRVREELRHVRERFGGGMLFVTHDHADAMTIADELAIVMDGRVVDYGDPQRVYDDPANARIAGFLGTRPMNLFEGALVGESEDALIGIRPERMRIADDSFLRGRVTRIESTGADAYVHVRLQSETIQVRVPAAAVSPIGSEVGIAWSRADVRRFSRSDGAALR